MNTNDPKVALAKLITALERHLDVVLTSDGADESRIEAVEEKLIEAFENYDSILFENFSVATPFAVFDDFGDEEGQDEFDADLDSDYNEYEDDEDDYDDLELADEFEEIDSDFDDFDALNK